ncbi:hypothetical protein EML15_06170 [Corynebacterium sp. sy017]|uniref:LpqB family beta-propeller domain-containing protein n=1 Tax=unclassified Corynebacterium TaxID=2624378 RepID=UPI0011858B07|nr:MULTISPECIES: LpqB family beta-propeller domain-containing protein [unclassified Corynebacterium]MBP3088735.1 hypothetical protein [Corynebacterium sp. sy017]QDZ42129.1 hypothetical protein FQV43_02290 [Corynebacterium sp. sy039]TSD92017.1 hypothetical protein ELY17_06170 [Corynebacterium sp. SY003]
MNRHEVKRIFSCVVSASVLLCSACTALPSNTEPQVLRDFSDSAQDKVETPIQDREPDLLVRDFFVANAQPTQQYQSARAFLTEDNASRWQPSATVYVVDRLDVNLASNNPGRDAANAGSKDYLAYQVQGTIVGTLGPGGGFVPRDEKYSDVVELKKENGQWRINSLPTRIVVERSELRNRYAQHDLYFFDPSGSVLVADKRWIYNTNAAIDMNLLSLLLDGASDTLAPGVLNEVPNSAYFAGVKDGAYAFTGVSSLRKDAQRRLAAQIVWTLAAASVPGPYHLSFDGTQVTAPNSTAVELTVEDYPEYNPQASRRSVGTVYALSRGRLTRIYQGRLDPVPGQFGYMENIESADIATEKNLVVAVTASGAGASKASQLMLSTLNGEAIELLHARSLTRPSFEYGANSLWTVIDGTTVARISRSADTGEIAQTEVDTSDVPNAGDHLITSLRLSYSGVRAAFIIDGAVYVATVSRPNAGERKLTNVYEYLGKDTRAVSVEWEPDGSLLVGTADSQAPVQHVAGDGSITQWLSTSNIIAPVSSLASTGATVYASDARTALELNNSDSPFWREVQGLEGTQGKVIVPRY